MKKLIFLFLILKSFAFSVLIPVPIGSCSSGLANVFTSTRYAGGTCETFGYHTYSTTQDYQICESSDKIKYTRIISLNSLYNQSFTCYSCPVGTIYDINTATCINPAVGDDDGDGILNKCDPNYIDFISMDCDDDTKLNGVDEDLDGDGVNNIYDTNPFTAGTNDYDISCKGANTSLTSSLPFAFSSYKYYGDLDDFKCSNLLLNSFYDAAVSLSDKNAPRCEKSYCYVHEAKNKCDYDVSWYRPGVDWDYIPDTSESKCNLLVDGIKYSSASYIVPDSLKCPNTSFCFVKRVTTPPKSSNTEDDDPTMSSPDLNSTTADLSPLLNAQNTTNKHLDDLKNKTDDINQNLSDLKSTAKDTLDTNKLMSGILSDLKSNSDGSLSNQLQGLSLLTSLSEKLGLMSDTSTSNQVITNGKLDSLKDSSDIGNGILSTIKDDTVILKENSIKSTNNLEGKNSDGSAVDISDLTSGFASIDSVFSTASSSVASVKDSLANSKSIIENGFSIAPPSSSGCGSSISFNVFGKSSSIDLCTIFSSFGAVFYYVFYIVFMYISIRIFYNGFKVK